MSKLHFFRLEGKKIKYICNAGGQTSRKNITNDYFKVTCPECKELLIKDRVRMEVNKTIKEEIRFLEEWLGMYSEGEHRMLVCERDIFERIKELKDALVGESVA